MFSIVLGDAIAHQIQQIALIRSELASIVEETVSSAGSELVQDLRDAAPRGSGDGGQAPDGDASGPLAESFIYDVQSSDGQATLTIRTTQPTKLKFVREGTGIHGPLGGRIYPKFKKALSWPNADHPYRSVAGQEANDFVSPILDGAGDEVDSRVRDVLAAALQMLET